MAEDFHFSVNPDLGQLESRIQQEIDLNRSKVRVAADVSGEGVDASRHEQATESQLAAECFASSSSNLSQAIRSGRDRNRGEPTCRASQDQGDREPLKAFC